MNFLRRFLQKSYKNTHATRILNLKTRLQRVIMLDREIDNVIKLRGFKDIINEKKSIFEERVCSFF